VVKVIYVTKEAKQELSKYLSINKRSGNSSLRIVDKGQGKLELIADARRPDDEVVEFEGKILLVIEPALSSGPKNISLDAYTSADVHRVVISEEDINQLSSSVTVNWISFPKMSYRKN
jgi:hypothetical protein